MRKLKFLMMMLFVMVFTSAQAQTHIWPRTYGTWNRLAPQNPGPVTGTIKVPVIFVDFKQQNSGGKGKDAWTDDAFMIDQVHQNSWISDLNESTGYGANKYFNDMSYGNVNVEFVKVGTYTATGNSATNADTYTNLVTQAVQNVTYSNWSNFDFNSDGFIDIVLLIYAGHAKNDRTSGGKTVTSAIYPRSGWTDGDGTVHNGTLINGYKFSRFSLIADLADYSINRDALSTAIHELGHGLFDLPDYYNKSGSQDPNMGLWDAMDYGMYYGGNVPVPGLSSFSKMLNGWLTPTELTKTGHYVLRPLTDNAECYMLKVNDNEYFLLEARNTNAGSWDSGLASGLVLTYVNESNNDWILYHGENGGKVTVKRADGANWAFNNFTSNFESQPFGPSVKAIPSTVNDIFDTKRVFNISINGDGSVEFDFMNLEEGMSLGDITNQTVVQVYNYNQLGSLVNDGGTIKAIGGSDNAVKAAYNDGRVFDPQYSAAFDETNTKNLWQIMSQNGQLYLVNVANAQTVDVNNPTAFISNPTVVNITEVPGKDNVYYISSATGKMSASVFMTSNYTADTYVLENHDPEGVVFKSTVNNYNSGQNLHITADLSTCQRSEENVLSLGENIDVWNGNHVHMFYTKATHELAVWLMRNQNETQRYDITLTSTDLVVDLLDNVLTVNGVQFTTADKPLLAGLTSLTTIVVGTSKSEEAKSSYASNYNISIGSYEYTPSPYPVSAIQEADPSTEWVFYQIPYTEPLSTDDVFGGETHQVKRKMETTTVDAWTLYDGTITPCNADLTGGTEFLILSDNGYWGLGAPLTTKKDKNKLASYPGPGNVSNGGTGLYTGEVNSAGNLYSFKLTSDNKLYNVGTGEYLYMFARGASDYYCEYTSDVNEATVFTVSGTGSQLVLEYWTPHINNVPTIHLYLSSPSYDGAKFYPSQSESKLSIYTRTNNAEVFTPVSEIISIRTVEGYGTYYRTEDAYKMPEGLTGYFIEDATNSGELNTLERYTSGMIVPSQTALLLHGAKADYTAEIWEEVETAGEQTAKVFDDAELNQMRGTRDENGYTYVQGGEYYYFKLSYKGDNLGFYWGEDNGAAFKLNKEHTAYLAVLQSTGIKSFALPNFEDDTTDLRAIRIEETETSINNKDIFNIAGQRVSNNYKGIVIKNGKKFLVK